MQQITEIEKGKKRTAPLQVFYNLPALGTFTSEGGDNYTKKQIMTRIQQVLEGEKGLNYVPRVAFKESSLRKLTVEAVIYQNREAIALNYAAMLLAEGEYQRTLASEGAGGHEGGDWEGKFEGRKREITCCAVNIAYNNLSGIIAYAGNNLPEEKNKLVIAGVLTTGKLIHLHPMAAKPTFEDRVLDRQIIRLFVDKSNQRPSGWLKGDIIVAESAYQFNCAIVNLQRGGYGYFRSVTFNPLTYPGSHNSDGFDSLHAGVL